MHSPTIVPQYYEQPCHEDSQTIDLLPLKFTMHCNFFIQDKYLNIDILFKKEKGPFALIYGNLSYHVWALSRSFICLNALPTVFFFLSNVLYKRDLKIISFWVYDTPTLCLPALNLRSYDSVEQSADKKLSCSIWK